MAAAAASPVWAQTTASKKAPRYSASAARAKQAALAKVPRYKIDDHGDLVPDVRADAAIIYSPATGRVLWEEKAFDARSIASITKVMTALCILETSPDLSRHVTVLRADTKGASTTYLRSGQVATVSDLLHLLLIGSDNAAARVLARSSVLGAQGFVKRMNEKAAELGLTSTSYADPSGLLAANVSSAYDMARLIAYASGDELISGIMRMAEFTYRSNGRSRTVHNTNQLVGAPDVDVVGGKTGFISKAGYCLATLLRLPNVNETVAVVVLGARSNTARFWETRHLVNWLTTRLPGLTIGRSGQPGAPNPDIH
jgi:D-alanyl-D-alanine endopeptidase (penicillin-binding protein 7)